MDNGDSYYSSEEEEHSNKKEIMPTNDINKFCIARKRLSLWLQSGIHKKVEMKKLVRCLKRCAWFTLKTFWKSQIWKAFSFSSYLQQSGTEHKEQNTYPE